MREINIPFSGFYESMWSGLIDRAMEMAAENDHQRQTEDAIPEELRLEETVFHEKLFDAMDYRDAERALAADYVDELNRRLESELGLKLHLKFKLMSSPREYNFETDRLFSDISLAAAKRLFAFSRKLDDHEKLKAKIRRRFTSRDGFHSHYSNDFEVWKAKPLADWDHNELGTLLCIACDELGEDWDWSVYERLAESDYEYVDKAVDWKKYEASIAEARADLEEELRADDPDFVPPPTRCPYTTDMFEPRQ